MNKIAKRLACMILLALVSMQTHAQPAPPPFSSGTTTANNCAKWNAAGQLVDAGAPCGGGGGSVSITAADGSLVVSPSPLTGTGTIGLVHGTVTSGHVATWNGTGGALQDGGVPFAIPIASGVCAIWSTSGGLSTIGNCAQDHFIIGAASSSISAGAFSHAGVVGGTNNSITGGTAAIIVGGTNNGASASYCAVLGGTSNTCSNQAGTVGGQQNTGAAKYGATFGVLNSNSGQSSFVSGESGVYTGTENVGSGYRGADRGNTSVSIFGNGRRAAGKAQEETFVFQGSTTGAAALVLTTDNAAAGAANVAALANNSAASVEVSLVVMDVTTGGAISCRENSAAIYRGANAASTVVAAAAFNCSAAAGTMASFTTTPTITADTTNGGLKVTVTPNAANTDTLLAVARVQYVFVQN
jgi:hypothetical protein